MSGEYHFHSDGLDLYAHLEVPDSMERKLPGVLLIHGFPEGPGGGSNSADTLPELAKRISSEMGFVAMAPLLRGTGKSQGCFSLVGWRDDINAAVREMLKHPQVGTVWLVGFGSGGGVALCAAEKQQEIAGVAALATPADWSEWAASPKSLLVHARRSGVVSDPRFPENFDSWSKELKDLSADLSISKLASRPVLIVHGTEDDVVPSIEARVLADSHGSADLRFIEGAGHHLRHDPRAIAVLLGWLDRQRRSQ